MSTLIDLSDSLQDVVFGDREPHPDDIAQLRTEWVRDAAERYVECSPHYQRVALAAGFSPSDIECESDLARVPVLPVRIFKHDNLDMGIDATSYRCRSSGTQGERSVVIRDEAMMEAFAASLLYAARELLDLSGRAVVLALSPPSTESETWFSQIIELMSLAYDTRFFVHDGALDWRGLAAAIESRPHDQQVILVGPPFAVHEFLDAIKTNQLNVAVPNGLVLTGGGWKSIARSEVISRDHLTAELQKSLQVEPTSIRDMFNMVELNSVLVECRFALKHAPPWLTVIARDAYDLDPVPVGRAGILSFLDPTAMSYPGFVLSDDFGIVRDSCPCGRFTPSIEFTRRLDLVPSRGCASQLTLERELEITVGGPGA